MSTVDQLMTAAEASQFLRVSKRTVYVLAREGSLPSLWAGKRLRFRQSDLEAHLRRDRRTVRGN